MLYLSYMMNEVSREQQFMDWYAKYSDAIFRHCYFRLRGDRERAKEIVQEVFMKTWEYSLNNEIKNARAFLYRVATNLVINESKRKRTTASLEYLQEKQGIEPEAKGQDEVILQNAEFGHIFNILEKLSSEYRELITMRYIDELEPHEIAEIKGETANAVSVRLNRAVKKLRSIVIYGRKS